MIPKTKFSVLMPLTVAITLLGILVGFSDALGDVKTNISAQNAQLSEAKALTSNRQEKFKENLATFKTPDPVTSEVVKALKVYRETYNSSDVTKLKSVISDDFEVHYFGAKFIGFRFDSQKNTLVPPSKDAYIAAQKKDAYLKRRESWSSDINRNEDLIINLRDVYVTNDGKLAWVWTQTTYRSKYFKPRYQELFEFSLQDGWKLNRILVAPDEPKPNEVEVSLISLARIDARRLNDAGEIGALVDKHGPDAIFEDIIRLRCCIEDRRQPLVVVFAEPPPIGSNIVVREQAVGFAEIYTSSTNFSRTSPYAIFTGSGWFNSNLSVEIEVLVDDVSVAKGRL